MKILVSGSRSITNYDIVKQILDKFSSTATAVIEGGAGGVDSLARKWALANEVKLFEVQARWEDVSPPVVRKCNRFGKEYNALAGMKRNEEMIKMLTQKDVVVAIWDGKSTGTKHMIDLAIKKYNIPIIIILVVNDKITKVNTIIPEYKPKTRVVNLKHEPYDVYIGRGSKWGNPFRIGIDGTREEVIEKYRNYVLTRPDLLAALDELEGKRLGCYCKPLPCHGDVLVELIKKKKMRKL